MQTLAIYPKQPSCTANRINRLHSPKDTTISMSINHENLLPCTQPSWWYYRTQSFVVATIHSTVSTVWRHIIDVTSLWYRVDQKQLRIYGT